MPDAEIWRGLQVCEEQSRDGYDRDAFGTGYRSLEDDIIAALPATMKTAGQVYTPYSCLAFDIVPDGTAATDIEHIVALAEAHDSRIADGRRREIASDLDNLTIADPTVNRSQKSDRDAAGALEALLAGGGAELNCVDADTTSPTVVISSDAVAPVSGLGYPRDARGGEGGGARDPGDGHRSWWSVDEPDSRHAVRPAAPHVFTEATGRDLAGEWRRRATARGWPNGSSRQSPTRRRASTPRGAPPSTDSSALVPRPAPA